MTRVVLMTIAIHACYIGSKMVVSLLALDLGAGPFAVGVLAMLYALVPLLLSIHSGRMADTIGMRAPLLIGTLCTALAMLCGYLWRDLSGLYMVATLAGTGFVFFNVSNQNLAGTLGRPETRARNFSILSLGYATSTLLGPTSAGYAIDHAGHYLAFLMFAAFTTVPLVVLLAFAGFTRAGRPAAQPPERSALDLLRVARLRRIIATSGATVAAWELYGFYLPIFGHAIGLPASTIGLILGAYAIANFVARFAVPGMMRRFSTQAIMTSTLLLAGCCFLMLPFLREVSLLLAVSFTIGLGLGCAQPVLMTLAFDQSPPGRTGEVTGLRLTANNTARVAIPLLAGAMGATLGVVAVFWLNAASLLLLSRYVRK